MSKQRLLIISMHQFGYLTDSYKWCEYLREEYNIRYICYDVDQPKMQMSGVDVRYFKVSRFSNRYLRGFLFLLQCILNILFFNGKVLLVYFEKCELIKKILWFKKINLDIRTLSVNKDAEIRRKFDNKLRLACRKFDNVSIISEGLKNKLGNVERNVDVLPLGADVISLQEKNYISKIKLLYVGTLTARDIDKTLFGLRKFLDINKNISISYDIVGDGNANELDELKVLSSKLNLTEYVTFHGRLPYNKLTPFFDDCNVGIAFVPKTDYFMFQPPTKTFEYILSGLFTIATSTFSNAEIISDMNGLLIEDNANDFCEALGFVLENKGRFNETKIRNSLNNSLWSNIVNLYVKPILLKI